MNRDTMLHFKAISTIDYCHWALEQIVRGGPRTPIDELIDKATGLDQTRREQAKELIEAIIAAKKYLKISCSDERKILKQL